MILYQFHFQDDIQKFFLHITTRDCVSLNINDQEIFTQLCLEMFATGGLSFVIILEKEANLRKAFDNFDPTIIVNYDAEKISELMIDSEITQNLKK